MNRILLQEKVQDSLQRIGPRAVLIHGRNDTVPPIEDARRVATATGAALIEVPGNHQQYFDGGVETIHHAITEKKHEKEHRSPASRRHRRLRAAGATRNRTDDDRPDLEY